MPNIYEKYAGLIPQLMPDPQRLQGLLQPQQTRLQAGLLGASSGVLPLMGVRDRPVGLGEVLLAAGTGAQAGLQQKQQSDLTSALQGLNIASTLKDLSTEDLKLSNAARMAVEAGYPVGTPEHQEFVKNVALKPSTSINIGDKADLKFIEKQIDIAEEDKIKTDNWQINSQAINKIERGLSNFETGAFGDTRLFIGEVGSLLGFDMTDDRFFDPTGKLTAIGANEFNRSLMDGLQNLNTQEVKIIQGMNPQTSNLPYVNEAIVDTLKINNQADRKLNELSNQFLAQEITYKDYTQQQKQIKDEATKQANDLFESAKTIDQKIPSILKEDVGELVTAINVNGKQIQTQVDSTDKWTGRTDIDGNLVIKKLDGSLYVLFPED